MITTSRIAKEVGRTPKTVRLWAEKLGIGKKIDSGVENSPLVFSEDEREKIRAYHIMLTKGGKK